MNSNEFGIYIFTSLNNKVTNNTANSNDFGIYFAPDANNNQLLNNQIINNTFKDILDDTTNSEINYLIYNNSFGDIKWYDNGTGSFLRDMNLIGNIGLGIHLSI